MLAMNAAAMAALETPHLLAALEAEGYLTPAEAELARRLETLMEDHDALRANFEGALQKVYAVIQEAGLEP